MVRLVRAPAPAHIRTMTVQLPAEQGAVSKPATTVWFDGACPLCAREIAWMKKRDRKGRLRFVDVSDEATPCPVDRTALLARFHAEEDGELLSGAAAFAAMWRQLPWLRPLGLAARHPAILAVLERIYRIFLHVRPGLQGLARRRERSRPYKEADPT